MKKGRRYIEPVIGKGDKDIKKRDITQVCFASKAWAPSYSLTRHYTKFSIKDYIKEQNEIWFNRIYKNKKGLKSQAFKLHISFL